MPNFQQLLLQSSVSHAISEIILWWFGTQHYIYLYQQVCCLNFFLEIWNLRVQTNQNTEKIAFKAVQMKFLAMHITNQKLSFDIFTVGNLQNIYIIIYNNFYPYNVFFGYCYKYTPAT